MNGTFQKGMVVFLLLIVFALIVYTFMKRYETFESNVVLSYFYLPGCGWCQKFNPEWERFVEMVKAEKLAVEVRKVNAEEARDEVAKEKIQGFPHIHLKTKSGERVDYEDERKAESLVKFVKQHSA